MNRRWILVAVAAVLGAPACGGGSQRASDLGIDADLGLVEPDGQDGDADAPGDRDLDREDGVGDPTPADTFTDPSPPLDATDIPDTPDVPAACTPPAAPWLWLPLADPSGGLFPDVSGNAHDAEPLGLAGAIAGPGRPARALGGSAFLRVGSPRTMPRGPSGTVALWARADVSARPRVLFHRADVLDLDRDGRLDVVFANGYDDATGYLTDSYVYRNGAEGFAAEPVRIPTQGASGLAAADLDGDGWLDLVIGQRTTGLPAPNATNVYRGSPAGLVPDPDGALNDAPGGVAIADLDGDGRFDLVFGQAEGDDTAVRVIPGSAEGFDRARAVLLPAGTPGGITVADVNGDGLPDLVTSNINGSASRPASSWLYLNAPGGFDPANPRGLATFSAYGNAAWDLDQDGYVDLVFGSYWDEPGTPDPTDDRYAVDSLVYPGGPSGFDPVRRIGLPSFGGLDPAVADLDDDGWPDLLLPNYYDGVKTPDGHLSKALDVPSRVYPGSVAGFDRARFTELPAHGCTGMAVGDLDGDGRADVVVPSVWDGTTHTLESHAFLGGPGGFDPAQSIAFPTRGAGGVSVPGSPYCGAASSLGTQPCRYGSIRLWIEGGRVVFELHDARGRPTRLDAPFPSAQWAHVAATWDAAAGEVRLYVDGALADSRTVAFAMGDSFPWRARIGADVEGGDRFVGGVADVRAWARVLSGEDVACLAGPAQP